ncbi:MAG: right-handed parallel beta-helix repeat-containing protein, partial [Candidatus Acidiferrales bacterium]
QMKKLLLLFIVAFLVTIFFARTSFAQITDAADRRRPNILVDDDKVQCPTAAYTSIQAAVNAANPGDYIRVCPGTYPEQVTISKSLLIRADNGVTVIPSSVVSNATGPSGDAVAAIFVVENSDDVQLAGFIVDGSANGLSQCSPRLVGILYENASGAILHNAVRNTQLASSLNGCQSGNAIEVESASSMQSRVGIAENSIDSYQKNGITANEAGSLVLIDGNTVTGIGPTTGAAQNGIQIGFGANGRIINNVVADNVYSPCVSVSNCPADAAGILIYQSDGVTIDHNTVGASQIGVLVAANSAFVTNNTVFHSALLDGIALIGNTNSASRNTISNSGEAAVYVQGNNNSISENDITGASVGILKISGSTGTVRFGNQFFATGIPVEDPAPPRNFTPVPSH